MSYFMFENKQVYFEEFGEGMPLLLLHGNTASSNMFEELIQTYASSFHLIVIDFLGHGKSERLDEFPIDLWFHEAQQVIAFLEEKNYKKINLIGSSGGALVAINVALERPDLVRRLIADSFEGEYPLLEIVQTMAAERALSKQDAQMKAFYTAMHGENWEQVVDCDTQAMEKHAKEIRLFFHMPLSALQSPILFTGSKQDEFVTSIDPKYFEKIYGEMILKIGHGEVFLFETGGHPAMLSNPIKFFELGREFFK